VDALAPDLVLRYLRELSADQIGAVVLAADGSLLAGPQALAEPARALIAAVPGTTPEIAVTGEAGSVFAARDAAHAVVVACTAHALGGLVLHDLRTALGDLAGAPAAAAAEPLRATVASPDRPSSEAASAAQRLLSAAQSRSGA
jgi:hypothetical protein